MPFLAYDSDFYFFSFHIDQGFHMYEHAAIANGHGLSVDYYNWFKILGENGLPKKQALWLTLRFDKLSMN